MQPCDALVWLRNDLRLTDNPALARAQSLGRAGLIYFVTPSMWQRHQLAPAKVDLLRRGLHGLAREAAALGIELEVRRVSSTRELAEQLEALAANAACSAVYANAEYPLDERRRDSYVGRALTRAGVEFGLCRDRLLVDPTQLLTGAGEPYKVFTPYKRRWLAQLVADPSALGECTVRAQGEPLAASAEAIDRAFSVCELRDLSVLWPAAGVEKRLASFCKSRIFNYQRNRDRPHLSGTSGLSPYLAIGALSPRQCVNAALAAAEQSLDGLTDEGVSCWINELAWREFYQYLMFHFDHLSQQLPFKRETRALPWRAAEDDFARWCRGETGYPIVDAAMRQLAQTGWMHNRLRMIVSMFLTKHLLIHWRWGEDFFMRQLIDGDFAANNGGWQWSASTGVDAAPYFRMFNPVAQSQKFDPEGVFIKRYLPELEPLAGKKLHDPQGAGYLMPVVDLKLGRERALNAFKTLAELRG